MPAGGASLRNAVKRKTHKERAQPSHRAKFGLLEKHKDYVLRARDFNRKKKRIQALQEKAAFRNKEEFYFKMEKTGTKDGVFVTQSSDSIDADTLKLLRSQDMNYISLKKKMEDEKIEKLKSNLHSIAALKNAPKMNSHTIFIDSDEDVESFEPAAHFDTAPELLDCAASRLHTEQIQHLERQAPLNVKTLKKMDKAREAQYRELAERMERQKKLQNALDYAEVQRKLLQKGRRKKIKDAEGGRPAQFVWKPERKK